MRYSVVRVSRFEMLVDQTFADVQEKASLRNDQCYSIRGSQSYLGRSVLCILDTQITSDIQAAIRLSERQN